jgi:DNA-binding response OmpR family regulator
MKPEKRILVVDDDDAIRTLVLTVLRRRGYHVDAARNGVEAMEMMGGCRYTLVILDLMMPRLSGYEVIEQLGRLSVMTRPRVLVLTAGQEPRSFDQDLVIGTIHKPFDVELLLDIVSGCLAASGDLDQLDDCPPDGESADAERLN